MRAPLNTALRRLNVSFQPTLLLRAVTSQCSRSRRTSPPVGQRFQPRLRAFPAAAAGPPSQPRVLAGASGPPKCGEPHAATQQSAKCVTASRPWRGPPRNEARNASTWEKDDGNGWRSKPSETDGTGRTSARRDTAGPRSPPGVPSAQSDGSHGNHVEARGVNHAASAAALPVFVRQTFNARGWDRPRACTRRRPRPRRPVTACGRGPAGTWLWACVGSTCPGIGP